MKKLLKISISFLLLLTLSSGISYAQEVMLYGAVRDDCGNDIPADGSLYTINPNTAESDLVGGPFGFDGVTAMVFLNNGRLVATATDDADDDDRSVLIEINPLTGQGSLIGQIGNDSVPGECGRVPGLTYNRATNTLYGIGVDCNGLSRPLLEINPNTAQATVIGPGTGINGAGNGLAINNQGMLFFTPSPPPNTLLFNINPVTGLAVEVANLNPLDKVNSLDFHPITGVLYGANTNNNIDLFQLATINTQNGTSIIIGDLPDCIDGLAFTPSNTSVPTLSEWGLIAMAAILGIVGFMVVRKRKLAV